MLKAIAACFKPSLTLALGLLLISNPAAARGHNAGAGQTASTAEGVIFKVPDGYMSASFPQEKGLLILHPKKPAGMFILYPPDNRKAEDLIADIKPAVARMFLHDPTTQLEWSETPLPAHRYVADESGKLMHTFDEKMRVQIVAYTRTVKGRELVYGYFAMQLKDGSDKKQHGEFVDETGSGVKDFDKFWKTIGANK